MSTEQRVQAYYKRYARAYAFQRPCLLMQICRLFKIPMRDVKQILGIVPKQPWPSPLPPGCVHEATGNCLGRVRWQWNHRTQSWEGNCSTHHSNWEYYRDTYQDLYVEIIEEHHRTKQGLTK